VARLIIMIFISVHRHISEVFSDKSAQMGSISSFVLQITIQRTKSIINHI